MPAPVALVLGARRIPNPSRGTLAIPHKPPNCRKTISPAKGQAAGEKSKAPRLVRSIAGQHAIRSATRGMVIKHHPAPCTSASPVCPPQQASRRVLAGCALLPVNEGIMVSVFLSPAKGRRLAGRLQKPRPGSPACKESGLGIKLPPLWWAGYTSAPYLSGPP